MVAKFDGAQSIPMPDVEVFFLLKDSFYYGPDTLEALEENRQIEALPEIDGDRKVPSMLSSADALVNEQQLLAYYRAVLDAAEKHGKIIDQYNHYFWLRLWIWNSEAGIRIGFPWYDTSDEIIDGVLLPIEGGRNGQLLLDGDQGWDIEIDADDKFIYIREGDEGFETVHAFVKFPRPAFAEACRAVVTRLDGILSRLSTELGRDFWKRRPYSDPSVDLVLVDAGLRTIDLVKELRTFMNHDVSVETIRRFMEDGGIIFSGGVPRDIAQSVKEQLEATGATVEIRERGSKPF